MSGFRIEKGGRGGDVGKEIDKFDGKFRRVMFTISNLITELLSLPSTDINNHARPSFPLRSHAQHGPKSSQSINQTVRQSPTYANIQMCLTQCCQQPQPNNESREGVSNYMGR